MAGAPERITLDVHESAELLACLQRALELGEETDNLDVVVMAGALMDMIIDKWLRRDDG